MYTSRFLNFIISWKVLVSECLKKCTTENRKAQNSKSQIGHSRCTKNIFADKFDVEWRRCKNIKYLEGKHGQGKHANMFYTLLMICTKISDNEISWLTSRRVKIRKISGLLKNTKRTVSFFSETFLIPKHQIQMAVLHIFFCFAEVDIFSCD